MTNAAAPAAPAALSAAGLKTLKTVAANGGEMNGWAGQRGFNCTSADKLVRDGYLESVPNCQHCVDLMTPRETPPCERPLAGQRNGDECYGRVRITEKGRAALA